MQVSICIGKYAYPNGAAYCASKFAVKAITEALRIELVNTPIRVSEVTPGTVHALLFMNADCCELICGVALQPLWKPSFLKFDLAAMSKRPARSTRASRRFLPMTLRTLFILLQVDLLMCKLRMWKCIQPTKRHQETFTVNQSFPSHCLSMLFF